MKKDFTINGWNMVIIIFLILVIAYTGWILKQTQQSSLVNSADDTLPDFIAYNIIAMETDENGQLHNKFISPKVVHYAKQDMAIYSEPHIIAYSATGKQPWDITAKKGKSLEGTTTLILQGDVKIHEPAGTQNNDIWIDTSKLVIYPKQNYAQTDQPVTFTQPGLVVHSIGMRVYFKEKRVELLNKAEGVYDAKQADKKLSR